MHVGASVSESFAITICPCRRCKSFFLMQPGELADAAG